LQSLEIANLSSNRISEIAELELDAISQIDLSKNELSSIPSNFGTLGRLKKLNLSNNQLTEFPEFLGTENLLESLNLSSNKIEGAVKFDFQKIRMLDELILADNEVTALNGTINKLEYIRHLGKIIGCKTLAY
jgi:Leucine-rich repeat (LRR) protein